jgi:hypothetical protein
MMTKNMRSKLREDRTNILDDVCVMHVFQQSDFAQRSGRYAIIAVIESNALECDHLIAL